MAKEQASPRPNPDRLKIDGEWKDAVGKALDREKPAEGWPDRNAEDEKQDQGRNAPTD